MPKAEAGSVKALAKNMKMKGLQRLRWWCEPCQRQMRDENGFKQHCLSEGHVREMQRLGSQGGKFIRNKTQEFLNDFMTLLRTSHGEKPIHVNRFYQEYIANKTHVHMNATSFNSLSELAKYLGREGRVKVTEDDKGLYIAWVDNSSDALRRKEALRKKERSEKGDEEREQKQILEQVRKAHMEAKDEMEFDEEARKLERKEGEKISLNFAPKPKTDHDTEVTNDAGETTRAASIETTDTPAETAEQTSAATSDAAASSAPAAAPIKMSLGAPKKGNVFASKKNALVTKKLVVKEAPKKMSEMERIMKEEMEKKRRYDGQGGGGKKMRIGM